MIECVNLPRYEIPYFDFGGWSCNTRHGMVWELFQDKDKQMNAGLYGEALVLVDKIIMSGKPPFGGWR